MKALVVGGGSGGHITPAVAVIRELLVLSPRAKVEFWTDRKYYRNVSKIVISNENVPRILVRKIAAGKFHRYAGWKWKDYFVNLQITLKDLVWGNIVGFCGFIGGIVQSFLRLVGKKNRPDVIFLKGGFVGLPVGLVARVLKIPYVAHESDAVPGLANRILMKHAARVCVGMSISEEPSSLVFTGTPVASEFKRISAGKQKELKKALGFDVDKPLVIVTGGSQGSENINEAMREILPEMLKFASVGIVAGRKHYEDMVDLKKYEEWDKAKLQSNFRLWEFHTAMNELMGAADVVVSRAGATTIAELAVLKKAIILVPFEKLPGGHQVKNAEHLQEIGAAVVVMDSRMAAQPGVLLDAVKHLVRSPKERESLAEKLAMEAEPEAAKKLAEILLEVAKGKKVGTDEKR